MNIYSSNTVKRAILCAMTFVSASALAQTYTFKIGAGRIDPRATSSDIEGTLPIGNGATISVPAGNQLEVMPKSTLLFSVERSLDEHWGLELALGVPPTHDVRLRVGEPIHHGASVYADKVAAAGSSNPATVINYLATHDYAAAGASAGAYATAAYKQYAAAAHVAQYDGQKVATVKQVAPTLFLNYKFLDAASTLRPYVGVGFNYTNFKVKSTSVGDSLYSDGPVRVTSTDSIGLAFQAGANYKLDKNWLVSASWATAAVKNNVTIQTNTSEEHLSYRFHPSVFSLMVGYQY